MIPRRVACDPKHQRDPRPNVHSVFYPGVGSSRQQGAKYAGPSGVTVTTRDGKESWRVCSRYSPRILHNVVPLPEVRDADVGLSLNPIRAVNQAATWAVGKFFRMEGNRPHYVYPTELNVGGRLDQDACIADVATAVKYVDALDNVGDAKQHIVMFGCSRGATTTLHAALRLPPDLARRVSLGGGAVRHARGCHGYVQLDAVRQPRGAAARRPLHARGVRAPGDHVAAVSDWGHLEPRGHTCASEPDDGVGGEAQGPLPAPHGGDARARHWAPQRHVVRHPRRRRAVHGVR